MEKYTEVDGDLIKLAKNGDFDVIAHGCNCQCIMGAGIAPQMAKAFACDQFPMESFLEQGEFNKLGQIDYKTIWVEDKHNPNWTGNGVSLIVVNAYTQFDVTGRRQGKIDLDYEALTLCMRKMNHIFKGKHIGLPRIGSHLAGGDWNIIKEIIKTELKDCFVTVVNYKP
jgi:O-acetyl-ADP-ribose deacetylase (regulator of RNase III)